MSLVRKLDDFLLALLVVAVADLVLFHSGAYFPVLQPDSFSGMIERQARRVAGLIEASPGRRRIVVMGNSKTEACIRETQLEAELAGLGPGYQAINMASGGSSPRAWYVLLTDGRLTRDNTEIVVLGVNVESLKAEKGNKRPDLRISKTRLRTAGALAMAGSYQGLENRLEVFSGVVFRSLLFRDDVKQYLRSPARRHRQIAESRTRFEAWTRAGGRVDNRSNDNLLSARLGKNGKLVFDELDDSLKRRDGLRKGVQRMLRRRKQKLKAMARGEKRVRKLASEPGRAKLLGRLVDELNAAGIKVVFSVIPISPYSLGRPREVDHLANLLGELESRGADFAVWHDPELLRKLHSPAYYQDTLHVNAAGATIYTRALADFLASLLDPAGMR